MFRHGSVRQSWHGVVWAVPARRGKAVKVRWVGARYGLSRYGSLGQASSVMARLGCQGVAEHGMVWPGRAVMVWQCLVGSGSSW